MGFFKNKFVEKREGKITFGEGIVDNIVTLAVEELPYVKLNYKTPIKEKLKEGAVIVYVDKKGVDVDIFVDIHFSQRVSETVFRIQEAVRHSVESMTEYRILSVNVTVTGVYFDDLDSNVEVKVEEKPQEDKEENKDTTEKEKVWER